MKQEKMKMEIAVTLSEDSVNEIANAIGSQILNLMEGLLKPIYDEVKEINCTLTSIESDTSMMLCD